MSVFTCPNCSGSIAFDAELQAMKCPYCDTEVTIDDYKTALAAKNRMLVNEQSCPQCGATLLTTDTTVATFCSYCGSSVTLNSRLTEAERPRNIIPFKVSKKKAETIYRDRIHRTLLAPDWMEDPDNTAKFRGIYMPFHIFHFSHNGTWEGQVKESHIEHHGHNDYDVTRTYDVGAEVNATYNYIPVDAASGFPDGISRAVCPYRKEKEVRFEEAYYAGFYADRGDVPAEVYEDKYKAAVVADIGNRSSVKCGTLSVPAYEITPTINLKSEVRSSMFPVWFLSFRNKDKVNYACVNGDTGELAVDIPIDFTKYLKATLIVAAVVSLLLNLFTTIKPDELLWIVGAVALVAFIIANSLLNETYRRIRHYDDAGYLGEERERIIQKSRTRIFFGAFARICGGTFAMFAVIIIAAALDLNEDILASLIGIMFFGFPVLLGVSISKAVRSKGNTTTLRKKTAPLWWKIGVLIKPTLAIIAAFIVMTSPITINGITTQMAYLDTLCYGVAIFGICMIIWAAFDVVRTHNRFTMRDIPIFTQARGGDA